MNLVRKFAFAAALNVALASFSVAEAADPIGEVAAFKGFPKASGTGGARDLAKGSELFEGDTVKASNGGNVQIVLNDGTRLVVGPASQLVLETYLLRNEKTASKVAVKALRGYFRFITGNSAKSAYSITTPSATIGIRGTGFDIRVRSITLAAVMEGAINLAGVNEQAVNAEAGGCGVAEAGGGGTSAKLLEGRAKANRLRQDFPLIFNQGALAANFRLPTENCSKAVAPRAFGPGGSKDSPEPPKNEEPRQSPPPPPPGNGGQTNPTGGGEQLGGPIN
jgi:hypothetical protein